MEIVLFRHGLPHIDKGGRMSALEFGRWVCAYNEAGIDPASLPSPQALEEAGSCAFAVCSDLPRSTVSAKFLGVGEEATSLALFREMEMPHASWGYPRLTAGAWALLFRVLWLFGYANNAESFREARERARQCAQQLAELAQQHGKVLFVGHGSLNWFIARYLQEMGWQGPKRAPRRYWEYGIYRCQT